MPEPSTLLEPGTAPGRRRATAAAAATAAALTGVLLGAPSASAGTPAAPPLPAPSVPAGRVALTRPGELVPAGATDEGAVTVPGPVTLRVHLAGRDPAALAAAAGHVAAPGDPQYRHFLTPDQFAAAYGPSPEQTAAVTSWLRAAGLTITRTTAHSVDVTGPQRAAERAVGAALHSFRWQGRSLRAISSPVSVPQEVASAVSGVSGLDAVRPVVRPASVQPVPVTPAASASCSTSFGANPATALPTAYGSVQPWQGCGYLPAQLRSAYGLAGTGLTGAGSRVAVVGAYASATLAPDVAAFAAAHGEPSWAAGQLTEAVPGGLPPQPLAWSMEETMDVEAVHAVAPGGQVVYVAAAGTSDDDFVDALARIVDGRLADVVSNSWMIGSDTGVPARTVSAFRQLFLQGAVEGIGFVAASGDTGSQAATDDGTGPVETGTEYPASDPWVTAVGGTTLAVDGSGGYQWEAGWESDYAELSADGTSWQNLPGTFANGSGGGPSGLFARPAYQRRVVADSAGVRSGRARRMVPDVAMDADPVTGMLVGQTLTLPTGSFYVQYSSGGSSLAAPLFAGVQALAQQKARCALGFANPAIYRAAAGGAFRDVTAVPGGTTGPLAAAHTVSSISSTGTISTRSVLATFGRAQDTGLAVTAGYDIVTGLGSPTSRYLDLAG